MSIINNVTQYITPSTTFNSTTSNPIVLPFDRINASERPPYAFLAFGTFTSFLITLYIFYNEQDDKSQNAQKEHLQKKSNHNIAEEETKEDVQCQSPHYEELPDAPMAKSDLEMGDRPNHKNDEKSNNSVNDNSCCCSCIKPYYKKHAKTIKWLVVIYQVASLIYTFTYTWRLASEAAPDKGSVSWNNYQVFAKAFAISSHFKSVITTAFVLASKKKILDKLNGNKSGNVKYDTTVMVYLFCFALSCAFYGLTFFWTHLLPGIVIFCPLVFLGAAGFGTFLGIIYLLGKYVIRGQYEEVEDNKEWDIDWIIWIGGLLCTITAVICVIVMEATVLYWDKPDLETWMNGVILVFTQRDSKAYMDGITTKTKKLINFIALLL